MDPVTHTLLGAALAETGLKERTALGTAALLVGANLPDVDVLAYAAGPYTALAFRRGVTHGVLAWFVLPLLLWLALLAWDRHVRRRGGREPPHRVEPRALLLLAALGVMSHPLLDLLNTYGIRLLMPFSERWLYGDTLFIVDPWVWALLAAGVAAARRRRRAAARGSATGHAYAAGRPAILALACLAFYVISMAASNAAARSLVASEWESLGVRPERMMAAPMPANPFRRWVVVEAGGVYRFARLRWLPTPRVELDSLKLPRHPANPVASAATRGPRVRHFLTWARFPYSVVDRGSNSVRVHLADARYTLEPVGSWASLTVALGPKPTAQ